MLQLSGTSASPGQRADWTELLPELLKSRKPPTVEQFATAVQAVASSLEQGYIDEVDADMLLRHLCSTFIASEVLGLLPTLSANPFERPRGNNASMSMGLFSGLNRW
jgi:hypothetical protein